MKKIIVLMVAVLFAGFANAQTRTQVKTTDLKKEITDYVAKNYAGYAIKEAFKVEANKVITFEVLAQKESSKMTLVFNDKGGFLKAENSKPTATKTTTTTHKPTPTTSTKPKTGTK
jgi:hypothetical protein